MFTKKHYIAIAGILHRVRERARDGDLSITVMDNAIEEELADLFEVDSTNFNRVLFTSMAHVGGLDKVEGEGYATIH